MSVGVMMGMAVLMAGAMGDGGLKASFQAGLNLRLGCGSGDAGIDIHARRFQVGDGSASRPPTMTVRTPCSPSQPVMPQAC